MKRVAITSAIEGKQSVLNNTYIRAFNVHNSEQQLIPFIIPSFIDEIAEFIPKFQDEIYKKKAKEIESISDALVLSGGGDINPINYQEENQSSNYCNSKRDLSEMYLLQAFIEAKKPIMGICRGMQLIGLKFNLNYFFQDIGFTEELHNGNSNELSSRKEVAHGIELYDSLAELGQLTFGNTKFSVNSFHHQGFCLTKDGETPKNKEKAIKDLNEEGQLTILASTEKVIEAFQHKTLPIFGIQWHPEEYENSIFIEYFINHFIYKEKSL